MTTWLWRAGWVVGVASALVLLQRGQLFAAAIVAAVCVAVHPFGSRRTRAIRRFRRDWAEQGKDLILVYSDSPHWRSHAEDTWIPRWGQRAVVLNWSERRSWRQHASEVVVFKICGGQREFNPLAIVITPSGDARVVRFYRAFKARQRGRHDLLTAAESQLDDYLRQCGRA
jgi:hypothetical protein